MIYDVTRAHAPIIPSGTEFNQRYFEWQIAVAGSKKTVGPAQSLVTIGSAEWCDLRLKHMPPVGGVLYNCGSKILFCNLSGSKHVPATSIRSNCTLRLRNQALDLKFRPQGEEEPNPTWPEIEFFWKEWTERRWLTSPMAAIGSDYPSRYRLRGSTLAACHAVIIWHAGCLQWVDLSEPIRLDQDQRVKQVELGHVKLCHEIAVRFCGVSTINNMPSENRQILPEFQAAKKQQEIDRVSAKILRRITSRPSKGRTARTVVYFLTMSSVLLATGILGFRLLLLLHPHL